MRHNKTYTLSLFTHSKLRHRERRPGASFELTVYANRMAPPEKERKSVLGVGRLSNDPNAWRPSKALSKDPSLSLLGETTQNQKAAKTDSRDAAASSREDAPAWQPSKAAEARLSSLSPARGRKRFATRARTRLLFTSVLFVSAAYFFVKLWLTPEAGQLHAALAIAGAITILIFISSIIGAVRRRGRERGDDKSTLRL